MEEECFTAARVCTSETVELAQDLSLSCVCVWALGAGLMKISHRFCSCCLIAGYWNYPGVWNIERSAVQVLLMT